MQETVREVLQNDLIEFIRAIAGDLPSLGNAATASHWTRVVAQRKSVPLAFLVSK
jgi:hypothetical protein